MSAPAYMPRAIGLTRPRRIVVRLADAIRWVSDFMWAWAWSGSGIDPYDDVNVRDADYWWSVNISDFGKRWRGRCAPHRKCRDCGRWTIRWWREVEGTCPDECLPF